MGRPRKYHTDEERKAAKKEYNASYYQRQNDRFREVAFETPASEASAQSLTQQQIAAQTHQDLNDELVLDDQDVSADRTQPSLAVEQSPIHESVEEEISSAIRELSIQPGGPSSRRSSDSVKPRHAVPYTNHELARRNTPRAPNVVTRSRSRQASTLPAAQPLSPTARPESNERTLEIGRRADREDSNEQVIFEDDALGGLKDGDGTDGREVSYQVGNSGIESRRSTGTVTTDTRNGSVPITLTNNESEPHSVVEAAAPPDVDLQLPDPDTTDGLEQVVRLIQQEFCDCDHAYATDGLSVAELTAKWQQALPRMTDKPQTRLMQLANMVQFEGRTHDVQNLEWRRLLCETHKLDVTRGVEDSTPPETERRYDIDSIILHCKNLAVFRGGVQVTMVPTYFNKIEQNTHAPINGCQVHRCKQVFLGTGLIAGGHGYKATIIFPRLPVNKITKEIALTDGQMRTWVDEILHPSLVEVLPANVLARLPRSFEDAKARANVKQEAAFTSAGQPAVTRHAVRAEFLDELWGKIVAKCNAVDSLGTSANAFGGPILMVWVHGVKAQFDAVSADDILAQLHAHLQLCFVLEHIDLTQSWFDLGSDHVATGQTAVEGDGQPQAAVYTVLPLNPCLDRWESTFRDNGKKASVRSDRYHFALTRDLGSRSLEIGEDNPLREAGLIHAKAYGTNKEIFTTQLKNYLPFGNTAFQALTFSQANLDKIYKEGNATSSTLSKAKVRERYLQTRTRLSYALYEEGQDVEGSAKSFPCRFEYRLRLDIVKRLRTAILAAEERAARQPQRATDGQHRPFHLYPTNEINDFVAVSLERFLWIIELASMAADGQNQQSTDMSISFDEQLNNATVVSAALECVLAISDGQVKQRQGLWKEFSVPRRDFARRQGETAEQQADRHVNTRKRGLKLGPTVTKYGIAYLPEDLLVLSGFIPRIRESLLGTVFFDHRVLADRLTARPNLTLMISTESRLVEAFRQRVQDAVADGGTLSVAKLKSCHLGAQMVIRAYILDVFTTLVERRQRLTKTEKRISFKYAKTILFSRLNANERRGVAGLDLVILGKMCEPDGMPSVSFVKPSGRDSARGATIYDTYGTNSWRDRLGPLFDVSTHCKPAIWDGKKYRTLLYTVYRIVETAFGGAWAGTFTKILITQATRHIWVVLQHEWLGKWSTMVKSFKANSLERQLEIEGMNSLERTHVNCVQFTGELGELIRLGVDNQGVFARSRWRTRWERIAAEPELWDRDTETAHQLSHRQGGGPYRIARHWLGGQDLTLLPDFAAEHGISLDLEVALDEN